MTDYVNLSDKANGDPSQAQVEVPESVEMGGKIEALTFAVAPAWKKVVRYLVYLCSGLIMYLFSLWFPGLKNALTFVKSTEEEADWIIVTGADKKSEAVPLITEQTSTQRMKVFTYRLFKYFFDNQSKVFKPAQFNIDKIQCNDIHTTYENGLDEVAVNDNTVFYGKNLTDIPRKPCVKLLFEEVLSPFYLFQVYSFVVWSLDDYMAYALVICVFSVISISVSLIETLRTTNKLRKMSYYEIPVNVFRVINGQTQKINISSAELIPGDLLEVPENVMMPCDAILLNGSCIMNEAMLTGESIPVVKNSLPQNDINYNPKEDKQYTLFAGTKCIQARFYTGTSVLALVTLTGFATVKGELIRTMLFPKPSDFKFYADSFRFLAILALMALVGFFLDLPTFINAASKFGSGMLRTIIIKASEIVTITVPPALPTCMQVGVSVALARLKKKQTFCISPNKINEAGRVNVMCFDKTGTLTEDGLDLLGVRPVYFDTLHNKLSFAKLVKDSPKLSHKIDAGVRNTALQNYISLEKNNLYSITKLLPSEQLLEIMATCHSLTFVKDSMIGDPLDIKMYEATKWIFEENDQHKYDPMVNAIVRTPGPDTAKFTDDLGSGETQNKREVAIIRRFEFLSKLQRMSAVVKDMNEAEFKLHLKGSPEKVRELCHPSTIPDNFHSVLEKYTQDGYRVLAVGSKNIGTDYKSIMAAKREDLEYDFTFIGFLIMENKLKPVTTNIIDMLHGAQIKTIMVTGDNVLTAISVARQCHIVGQNQRIFLGDMSETKVNGKSVIHWKDFEFSDQRLTDDLEPELIYGKNPLKGEDYAIDSPVKTTFAQSSFGDTNLIVPEDMSPTMKGEGLDYSIVDLEPPFFNMGDKEDYCLAVSGKAFSHILQEVEINKNPKFEHILAKMLRKASVYARMHPDEKALMIKYMMGNKKNTVGMCGDGANDVGALKTANVGVSLSEAEASIAAPFTSKIQDISCIPNLLREGRSALATSYQAFKYMALYSVIQFTSVTILYHHLIELTNWHYYHIDMFIILPLSATMAMSGTYEYLTRFKPTGRLVSVQILTSVIGQATIQIGFQLLTWNILVRQNWYVPYTLGFDNQPPCYENTSMYLVSLYQYCTVALAFLVGKPFRKSFYTNYFFTGILIFEYLAVLTVTFNPFNWQFFYGQTLQAMFPLNRSWEVTILIIGVVNATMTLLWERIIVKYVSLKWKDHRDHKEQQKLETTSHFETGSLVPQDQHETKRRPNTYSLVKENEVL